jgi:hypothetical protein
MRWIDSMRFGPFAVTLVLGFLALRLFALTADPPARLVSHYQDVAFSVFDEGWWTANAREAVRFGSRLGTGFDLFWVSPVFTLWMTAVFSIGGASLATARLASIAVGAAGLWLLLAAGRRERDSAAERAVRIAALLWVVSFAGGQLGRLALPETLGTTLGLAGAVMLLRGGRAGNVAAGALAALATLTKPQLGFLVPAFVVAGAWLAVRRGRPGLAAVVATAGGAVVPIAIWGAYAAAHADAALELGRFYLDSRWFAGTPPAGGALALAKPLVQTAVAGVVYRHPFLVHLPGVFLLAWLAIPTVLEAARRPRETSCPDIVIVFGAWAVAGGLAISAIPFQPFRYYLPLVPALVVLAAWFLCRGADPSDAERERGWRRIFTWAASTTILVQVVFAVAVATLLPSLVDRATERVALLSPVEFRLTSFLLEVFRTRSLTSFAALPRELAYVAALALLAVGSLGVAGLMALAAARPLARGLPSPGERPGPILGLLIAYQLLFWLVWIPERATTLRDMGRTLDRSLPATAVVSPGGTYALESALRFDSRAVRERRMFDATGPATHFVVLGSHPLIGALPEGEIERRWPGSERVATFALTGDYVYHLYRAAPD